MRNKRLIPLSLLLVLALNFTPIVARAWEEGSIHVPKNTSANISPNATRDANDHGCDDWWADFYSVPEDKLGSLGVWSTNLLNQLHIDTRTPPGLDGFYECSGGYCTVHLCTKDGWGFNAGSIRLRIP